MSSHFDPTPPTGNRSVARVHRHCVLATVSYGGHFKVLLQFFLSYAANVLDPHACGLMVLVSTETEATSLWSLLRAEPRLQDAVLPQLTITDLPSTLALLSPGTKTELPSTKNRGKWGRLYVCAKKAYAARYAHEVLGTAHAIVTDSEAYIWKPLSMRQLFATQMAEPTVWFADAPILHKPEASRGAASTQKARVDTNWCSMHIYSDSRGMTRQAMLKRLPSPTATFFECATRAVTQSLCRHPEPVPLTHTAYVRPWQVHAVLVPAHALPRILACRRDHVEAAVV